MEYEKMLDRLYESLPKHTLNRDRFEMPIAESFIQGNKTILKNFGAILKKIGRDEKHMIKYFAKETATSVTQEEGRLILNRKFPYEQVNKLVKNYITQFVICPECGRPDTEVIDKHSVRMLHCEACGAVSAVKGL